MNHHVCLFQTVSPEGFTPAVCAHLVHHLANFVRLLPSLLDQIRLPNSTAYAQCRQRPRTEGVSNSCPALAEGEGSSATSIVPVSRLCRICFMFCSVDLCNDFELRRSGGTSITGTRDSCDGEQSLQLGHDSYCRMPIPFFRNRALLPAALHEP